MELKLVLPIANTKQWLLAKSLEILGDNSLLEYNILKRNLIESFIEEIGNNFLDFTLGLSKIPENVNTKIYLTLDNERIGTMFKELTLQDILEFYSLLVKDYNLLINFLRVRLLKDKEFIYTIEYSSCFPDDIILILNIKE